MRRVAVGKMLISDDQNHLDMVMISLLLFCSRLCMERIFQKGRILNAHFSFWAEEGRQ